VLAGHGCGHVCVHTRWQFLDVVIYAHGRGHDAVLQMLGTVLAETRLGARSLSGLRVAPARVQDMHGNMHGQLIMDLESSALQMH
jgi:hypothetical protein